MERKREIFCTIRLLPIIDLRKTEIETETERNSYKSPSFFIFNSSFFIDLGTRSSAGRVPVFETEGRKFEPCRVHHKFAF